MAGVALGGTAACSTSTSGGSGGANAMDFWYWTDGLSKNVVDDAVKRFTEVELKPQQIGGNFKEKLVTTMASGGDFIPDITGIKGEVEEGHDQGREADRLPDRHRPDRVVLPPGRVRQGRAAE